MHLMILFVLVISMLIGLLRIVKGPEEADRMLAVQLFSTTGIAMLLVIGELTGRTGILNIALCFALLAPITLTAFIRMVSKPMAGKSGISKSQ